MESPEKAGGHPRLLRCDVVNAAGEESIRYVELEQYRLWEYMMRTRHGIQVRGLQLGMWFEMPEFQAHAGPFAHGGPIENVTCITLSLFNSRHNYTLDVDRFIPTIHCETVKRILLSHLADSGAASRAVELVERHGVCVSRVIEDPGLELILGLSDVEVIPDTATPV